MTIDAMRLRNFRGFEDATIELKPLTVLLGPNSAGKSCFGQALAAWAHAKRLSPAGLLNLAPPTRDDPTWPVDLGSVDELRRRGAVGPVMICFRDDKEGWLDVGFGRDDEPGLQQSSVTLSVPAPEGDPVAAQLVRTSPGAESGTIFLSRQDELTWVAGDESPALRVSIDSGRLRTVEVLTYSNPVVIPAVHPILFNRIIYDRIDSFIDHVAYLRPDRAPPLHLYETRRETPNRVGYRGEFVPSILARDPHDQPHCTFREPPDLPQTMEKAVADLDSDWRLEKLPLPDAVRHWLVRLHLASSLRADTADRWVRLNVTIDPDPTPRSLTDVGFGVSQAIPLLVAGLILENGGSLIVDLPEAHLHPRPQSELADFFCSLALSGKQVLLETHSEMLFHRLRLRAAMHNALASKIAVYFVDEPDNGTCRPPRLLDLGPQGTITWPVGFLAESWDVRVALEAAWEAREMKARRQ